jgi:hypothetical protein
VVLHSELYVSAGPSYDIDEVLATYLEVTTGGRRGGATTTIHTIVQFRGVEGIDDREFDLVLDHRHIHETVHVVGHFGETNHE